MLLLICFSEKKFTLGVTLYLNSGTMSSDEEEDYMSAAVLGACDDVRPGLVHGTKKRQLDVEKKKKDCDKINKDKFKPKNVLEAEKREEGLSKAIETDNKGFQLMAKMGFKAGMALGKREEGRKEPVPIEVKTTREGLGRDADRKRKHQELIETLVSNAGYEKEWKKDRKNE